MIDMHHPVTGGTCQAVSDAQAELYETQGWKRGPAPATAEPVVPAEYFDGYGNRLTLAEAAERLGVPLEELQPTDPASVVTGPATVPPAVGSHPAAAPTDPDVDDDADEED